MKDTKLMYLEICTCINLSRWVYILILSLVTVVVNLIYVFFSFLRFHLTTRPDSRPSVLVSRAVAACVRHPVKQV